jgi:hypothetical protein
MNDEIKLVSKLTADTRKSSVGPAISNLINKRKDQPQ